MKVWIQRKPRNEFADVERRWRRRGLFRRERNGAVHIVGWVVLIAVVIGLGLWLSSTGEADQFLAFLS